MDRSFESDLDIFIQHVDSLAITLPMVKLVIEAVDQRAEKEYRTFLETKSTPSITENGESAFTVDTDQIFQFIKLKREHDSLRIAQVVIPRSFIVTLVSQFDIHLGRLLRTIFQLKPDILNVSQKQITFSDLQGYSSIDDIREHIIEKEIESVLRGSHDEQFAWLENKLGMKLREGLAVWPDFIEVTERRNLFVHNDGVVSTQYINVCRKHGVQLGSDTKLNTRLYVSRDYFDKAYQCIFEIGVKLGQVIWRKLIPDEISQADNSLNGSITHF